MTATDYYADDAEAAPLEGNTTVMFDESETTTIGDDAHAATAIERAAAPEMADAVPMGDLPGKSEWEQMCQMAVTLAESSIVPDALRRKPADILQILLTARDLKIGPTNALALVYVIKGKVSIAPKLRLALLNNSGRGTIRPAEDNTAERATAIIFDSDRRTELGRMTLTRDQVPAELLKKGPWKDWGQQMLWHRVAGFALDAYFPEAGIGLYSPDELGAVVDAEGEPIDVTTVSPPRGIGRPQAVPERPTEPPINKDTLLELDGIMAKIASDDSVKQAASEVWIKKFQKQPRRSFTQQQGVSAITLMRAYADQVAEIAVIVEDDVARCENCNTKMDEIDLETDNAFCKNCEPF